ncbi:hypothetical protein ACIOJE_13100 [Kitasatospora sp. NPDC087861]|uniref:hypothetical protein n=1 Tax=Kitasatospora sp. NPDC087861 TaxID=3364070 RepID=UPI0038200260
MRTAVPADDLGPGIRYGLGLAGMPLPCGDGAYWGHSGGIPGYQTRAGATEGGRRATSVAATVESSAPAVSKHLGSVMATALCR